uniref:Uncharacterized protein n=1 Tax=Globisporangium ultimum (strain ATCC 200006 / CBS 805.95 / DAOM BR144) TaxID=431595 RepID=K3WBI4_GLOUD
MSKVVEASLRLQSIPTGQSQAKPSILSSTSFDSDDSGDDSSSGSESEDSSGSDDSEEEEEPGFVAKISNAFKAKQQRLLDKRRHPVLEWKQAARWDEENDRGLALAEESRRRKEERVAEKAAVRERRVKRKAQRKNNKLKEKEFRELLQSYDNRLVRTEKRTELLTKFSIENRAKEKKNTVDQFLACQLEQESQAAQKIKHLHNEDQLRQLEVSRHLQHSIDTADEIGRRSGILPSMNAPAPAPLEEQDETSSLLVLRVNPPEGAPPRSASATALPSVQKTNGEAPSTLGNQGTGKRPTVVRVASTTVVPKRLFFTVNLKRFKHIDEIRGEAIGDRGGVELARSLLTGACPRVKRIYLGWNRIKYPGIAALADCFIRGACGQLQILDLRCNTIDAKSFQEILSVLEKGGLPELLDLILQGNVIGDDGAKAMAHAMLKGTLLALRLIDVRQNKIRNAGVQAIWNVFTSQCFKRCCPKLQLLDMRRNDASGSLTRSFCPCPPYLEF